MAGFSSLAEPQNLHPVYISVKPLVLSPVTASGSLRNNDIQHNPLSLHCHHLLFGEVKKKELDERDRQSDIFRSLSCRICTWQISLPHIWFCCWSQLVGVCSPTVNSITYHYIAATCCAVRLGNATRRVRKWLDLMRSLNRRICNQQTSMPGTRLWCWSHPVGVYAQTVYIAINHHRIATVCLCGEVKKYKSASVIDGQNSLARRVLESTLCRFPYHIFCFSPSHSQWESTYLLSSALPIIIVLLSSVGW